MNKEDLLFQISKKDFDKAYFVELILSDAVVRELLVEEMLTNKKIMVYYHCYYVISEASERSPELFYTDWSRYLDLLHHTNSYHRDIGLTILANLVAVDVQKFDLIIDEYFGLLQDEKFMTAECCLKNLEKIILLKPKYADAFVHRIIDILHTSRYSEKQQALFSGKLVELFDHVYEYLEDKKRMYDFALMNSDSISPKTRKIVKAFIKKYDIN